MSFELTTEDAGKVAFPDCAITQFRASESGLHFLSDGIFILGRGLILARCDVRCTGLEKIRSRRYADEEWNDADPVSSPGLREICEWSIDGGDLKFSGFEAVSGMWAEYVLPTFSMKAIVET